MLSFVVYFLPALIDFVAGQFFLIYPILMARQGQSDLAVTMLISIWGVCYAIMSSIAGRVVTPANSGRMLVRSCAAFTALCCLMSLRQDPWWVYICSGLFGCCGAFFFPPFQVFMKRIQSARARPVIHSVGHYTFAWSMGIAIGPLMAGFIIAADAVNGWRLCYLIDAVLCLATLVGVLWVEKRAPMRPVGESEPEVVIVPGLKIGATLPDLAWLGWVGTGAGLTALTFIRALFPPFSENELKLGADVQGTVFFIMCFMQGMAGLVLSYSGRFMYRPLAPLVFGSLGVAGALCFVFGSTEAMFYIGSLGFGAYAGFAFFYLVFHSLVHPQKSSRYVSVNEAVVGLSGILGAPIAGWLSDATGTSRVPFGAAVALVLIVVTFQAVIHRRNPLRSDA